MTMDLANDRQALVQQALEDIDQLLEGQQPDRDLLKRISARLMPLAERAELFPTTEFPAPAPDSGDTSSRYLLGQKADKSISLYMNVIVPGKSSKPHNHGTWAVIVSVSGEELNKIYQRVDDGSDPAYARLEQIGEHVVKPGAPINFLPDDIHSIHVAGNETVRHFHLYGKALETLTDRLGFDLETGVVSNYNKNHMRPTVEAQSN